MPRGNDAEAALHELADQFGRGVGNAEELIDANLAANTQALREAQLLPRDEEATREALENIEDYEGPDGEEVVSVTVRRAQSGGKRHTVIVYRTDEGRDLVAALSEDGKEVVTPEYEREQRAKALSGEDKARAQGKRKKAERTRSGGRDRGSTAGAPEGGIDKPEGSDAE